MAGSHTRSRHSLVGAHVPTTGGLIRGSLSYADRIGAEVIQIFSSSPRSWAMPVTDPAIDDEFRRTCAERKIPVFVHAPYLINFGSPNDVTLTKSVDATRYALARGIAVGAAGVVIHAGSAVSTDRNTALAQVSTTLLPLLDEIPDDGPLLLIEPTAGGGSSLAARAEDLAPYAQAVNWHPRLGFCLDICHLHAAGHDLSQPGGLESTMDEIYRTVDKGRIKLVHGNDSRDPTGSTRDRHETIGKGTIGETAFAEFFGIPALKGVPIVVETPRETDAQDVATLKRLRG